MAIDKDKLAAAIAERFGTTTVRIKTDDLNSRNRGIQPEPMDATAPTYRQQKQMQIMKEEATIRQGKEQAKVKRVKQAKNTSARNKQQAGALILAEPDTRTEEQKYIDIVTGKEAQLQRDAQIVDQVYANNPNATDYDVIQALEAADNAPVQPQISALTPTEEASYRLQARITPDPVKVENLRTFSNNAALMSRPDGSGVFILGPEATPEQIAANYDHQAYLASFDRMPLEAYLGFKLPGVNYPQYVYRGANAVRQFGNSAPVVKTADGLVKVGEWIARHPRTTASAVIGMSAVGNAAAQQMYGAVDSTALIASEYMSKHRKEIEDEGVHWIWKTLLTAGVGTAAYTTANYLLNNVPHLRSGWNSFQKLKNLKAKKGIGYRGAQYDTVGEAYKEYLKDYANIAKQRKLVGSNDGLSAEEVDEQLQALNREFTTFLKGNNISTNQLKVNSIYETNEAGRPILDEYGERILKQQPQLTITPGGIERAGRALTSVMPPAFGIGGSALTYSLIDWGTGSGSSNSNGVYTDTITYSLPDDTYKDLLLLFDSAAVEGAEPVKNNPTPDSTAQPAVEEYPSALNF